MRRRRPSSAERFGAATITAALVLAMGYALLAGLTVRIVATPQSLLASFDVTPPAPPPPPPPPAERPAPSPHREGAAAPPNLKSHATDLAAPKPVIPIVTPPPLVTTPQPATGADATSGNAAIPGPGTGAGGIGNGAGSGGEGNGSGGGGGTPPRQIAGSISKRDYPRDLFAAGIQGRVGVLYVVSPRGRVTDCEIEHSSGNAELDDATCDLIVRRFRFRPSLDANGRPVESMIEENHTWIID
ncbi:energy transducer TonB [Hephaestia mangrovi]|uniref:energy transducer TonB n=1 Tax=Hephaestia mangrovi TaxID=2873268 RepID=UPI00272E3E73|nr:energy transducer TonB [Hephaestia mangrovi]